MAEAGLDLEKSGLLYLSNEARVRPSLQPKGSQRQ